MSIRSIAVLSFMAMAHMKSWATSAPSTPLFRETLNRAASPIRAPEKEGILHTSKLRASGR